MAAVERAAEVDADDLIPHGRIHVGREPVPAGPGHAGVVVQDVQPAEVFDGGRDHRLAVGRHADVGVLRDGVGAALLQGLDGRGSTVVVDIGHHDLRARCGERDRTVAAQSGSGPGDDRDFPAEICHDVPLHRPTVVRS